MNFMVMSLLFFCAYRINLMEWKGIKQCQELQMEKESCS